MNKEIDDLLDINSKQNSSDTAIKPINNIRYLFIRLGVLFVLFILTNYIFFDGGGGGIGEVVVFFGGLYLIFLVVLIVELIYFQIKKKFQLRNFALITFLFFILSIVTLLNEI